MLNPITAVTHVNPYPYYAELVSSKPLYFDSTLGCWVASSANSVKAVLTSEFCRVHPISEPIPTHLLESSVADIFQHLVRMNDGNKHSSLKKTVSTTLESFDVTEITELSHRWSQVLLNELKSTIFPDRLSDFALRLPIYVMASLLGVPNNKLHQTSCWITDFVGCLAPNSTQGQIEQGQIAANNFLELFSFQHLGRLTFAQEEKSVGIANSIGYLMQTYEATAGLIGNTLIMLASHNNIHEQVVKTPNLLSPVIQEILRYDPPIQNTRRFLAQDSTIARQVMNKGDMILVILAAANRDPLVNPNPEQFDIFRKNRHLFTFGVGHHACPGEKLAMTIAKSALEALIADSIELPKAFSYRPSVNARIPLFGNRSNLP